MDSDSTIGEEDQLYLSRAYELAARAGGNTAPNPRVGAVVVRDGRVIGEGYHQRAGQAHAEVNALAEAGDARGATLYVSLEPCNHVGRTPACSMAVVSAGIARVVVGTMDPNPITQGGGVATLRNAGIRVDIAADPAAAKLIEDFTRAMRSDRPHIALKMAMSLDGYVTTRRGVQEWLTSDEARNYVRDLRIIYDAVMVGAGTIRVDDPQLTVRPPSTRSRPFTRVVVSETDTVPETSRVFTPVDGYKKTVVLAPAGLKERFENLRDVADVLFVGNETSMQIDLADAMRTLRRYGVQSALCEGGPTMAGRLIAANAVDRVYWLIAPTLLSTTESVPVLGDADLASLQKRIDFDIVERLGDDVLLSGALRPSASSG